MKADQRRGYETHNENDSPCGFSWHTNDAKTMETTTAEKFFFVYRARAQDYRPVKLFAWNEAVKISRVTLQMNRHTLW